MAHRSSDLDLDAPLARLRGIGPASAAALEAAGLSTIRDLLAWFPVRHDEVATVSGPSAALVGQLVRFPCRVLSTSLRFLPRRRSMVAVRVAAHDGGTAEVVFFNQPYRKDAFPPGCERVAEGILVQHGRRFLLRPGELLDPAAPAGPVRLRYPTVPGIAPARLRAWIARALAAVDLTRWPHVALPEGLATEPLLPMREAVRAMHAPADAAEHERARRTLALQQAVALFTVLEEARCARCAARAPAVAFTAALEARLRARIPLQWTADQAAALERIRAALSRPTPMGMLLQGDVGTGKTAVAVWAALAAVASGLQVAFLAPTELLAEQHFAKVSQWLAGSRVRVVLLTAGLAAAERAAAARAVADGTAQLVFGTHALLGERTTFRRLGLVVVDEQHRFGVEQRRALLRKGRHPHLLALTATPIPRTLALALFGDLDVAVLRQRPGGAPPARAVLTHPRRAKAQVWRAIARRVRRGQGVYVVCPSIGEAGEPTGAIAVHAALARTFACDLVHGRMPPAARQEAIARFREGVTRVLVGTTVLEVGIDVPHATLMVVVGAERFGLATLHQLRGRVGRGARRGLCILVGQANERTRALCRTTDGFALAETDLALRGSGELLGLRQSGAGELSALQPLADLELLLRARQAVQAAMRASDGHGVAPRAAGDAG